MIATMPRGTLKPDLEVTIGDEEGEANFTGLQPSSVKVLAEQNGAIKVHSTVDAVTPSTDGKSCLVRRAWAAGDTDTSGHMWVWIEVTWPVGKPQIFPSDGPLRLDIVRAAGDA